LLSYGDLTVFQDGSYPPSWILKTEIFNCHTERAMYLIAKNFVTIGQTVPEIWRFVDIFKWRPSTILDLL